MQQPQRRAACKHLKSVVVDAETKVTGKSHIAHIFPAAAERFIKRHQAIHLALESLESKALNPFGYRELWHRGNLPCARQLNLCAHKGCIAFIKERRHTQHHLWNKFAIGAMHRSIIALHHMENHRVVGRVGVVAVPAPVGGTHVHFHVTRPHVPVDFHLGIEEIRASVLIETPGVDNAHTPAIDRCHISHVVKPVLPHILHKFLHHGAIPPVCKNTQKTRNSHIVTPRTVFFLPWKQRKYRTSTFFENAKKADSKIFWNQPFIMLSMQYCSRQGARCRVAPWCDRRR